MNDGQDQDSFSFGLIENDVTAMLVPVHLFAKLRRLAAHVRVLAQQLKTMRKFALLQEGLH